MKKWRYFVFLLAYTTAQSQMLTVEKIMRDAKWIGTSPSGILWTYDNKAILFNWNPEKALSDSVYSCQLNSTAPLKLNYKDAQLAKAIRGGTYNHAHTKITFIYKEDVHLIDIISGKINRVTQTQEEERNPSFIMNEAWIAFQSGRDLFAWNIATGNTRQLTDFEKEKQPVKKIISQDQWLQQQQLNTSDVIKKRKEKKDAQTAYLERMKDADSIHIIYTGDKKVTGMQVSPDGRFISYNLSEEAINTKTAIVPNYITETGYTTDIASHSKAGVPHGKNLFYIFDRIKDTAILVKMDSLPGITDKPDYTKDYPAKFSDTAHPVREVYTQGIYWNEEGSAAVLDILSRDFKDRWLMQLDAATGKLKLLDRQRDEAWIGGPGIGWIGAANSGWINEHLFYFQSEASGYSHLYSYDITAHSKKQLTQGNYEIQQAIPSLDKKYFYIISNEEHP
ncbi:MAG: DPP IV N-terminal domain-containing protein, partial [Ferruginibacter sp.]